MILSNGAHGDSQLHRFNLEVFGHFVVTCNADMIQSKTFGHAEFLTT